MGVSKLGYLGSQGDQLLVGFRQLGVWVETSNKDIWKIAHLPGET